MKNVSTLVFILIATGITLFAQVPRKIGYQGLLNNADGTPIDGIHSFVFSLSTNSNGSSPVWTDGPVNVQVKKGSYSYILGSNPNNLFDLPFTVPYYLNISVRSIEPNPEFVVPLASAPYAFGAELDTLHVNKSIEVGNSIWIGTTDQNTTTNEIYSDNGDLLLQSHALNQYNTIINALGGNVGIGTTSPQARLQVNGSISLYGIDGDTSLFFGQEHVPAGILGEWGIQYWAGGLNFWKPFGSTGSRPGNGFGNNFLFLKDNGNIGIGCNNPQYLLDVSGTVRAKQILVNLGGCDFVFDENYPLLSLKERKAVVLEQRHLPNVPPASELQQGVSLGETTMTILQNVEEHEKYLYQYDERIERLEKLVFQQGKIIEKQNAIIEHQQSDRRK